MSARDSAFFIRNESGRGHRVTSRGRKVLLAFDIVGLIAFAGFVGALAGEQRIPAFVYILVAVFAAAPFLVGMYLTGLGPIAFLLHQARAMRGRNK